MTASRAWRAGQHQPVARRARRALRVTPPPLAAHRAQNAPLVVQRRRRAERVHSVLLASMHRQVRLLVRHAWEVILPLQAAMSARRALQAMPPRPKAARALSVRLVVSVRLAAQCAQLGGHAWPAKARHRRAQQRTIVCAPHVLAALPTPQRQTARLVSLWRRAVLSSTRLWRRHRCPTGNARPAPLGMRAMAVSPQRPVVQAQPPCSDPAHARSAMLGFTR